jgi:hypothetical protein
MLALHLREDAVRRAVAELRQRGQLARDLFEKQTTVARLQRFSRAARRRAVGRKARLEFSKLAAWTEAPGRATVGRLMIRWLFTRVL